MDTQALMHVLEKEIFIYVGVTLVLWFPVMLLVSQVSMAVREIALNTRKEDHPYFDTQYKALSWVAYGLFIVGWCSLVIGGVMIGKGLF
ncbi:MAG: hypothetical protein ACOYVJ_13015 [Nitrospirota bacterium]